MIEEIAIVDQRRCHLVSDGQPPQVLVVKPLGSFEWKCLQEECAMLAERVSVPFVMVAFEVDDMDSFRQPDEETYLFLTTQLVPELQRRYGELPLVLGGYSLGGLFALWCSTRTRCFQAVAACSPSLWVPWWADYAQTNPPLSQYVYLSVGDTEEKTRKHPFSLMGDSLRAQHQRHLSQLSPERCTLEWNAGGHFADIELRKAKGFAWCINHIFPC